MTAPNHIVGGLAITGISLSFWDINIFSNPFYLSSCIFFSMVPDVDHTKSIVGKAFFPLARYLDTNFGHRTITHSLTTLIPLFIFFLFVEIQIINPIYLKDNTSYSLIFLFAYLSHLILDMLTIQGIPLFYPFFKNPCVIPANPSLRFASGNVKSEAIALFIFTFILFTSYDLFKNGFWTTYNRSFGSVKHAFREFKESEYLILVKYNYTFNGKNKSGKAYVLDASENTLDLYEKNKIFTINSKDYRYKNINVLPEKTKYKYALTDLNLFNIPLSKLNDTLKNKIVSGKITASHNFIVNNKIDVNKLIDLKKEINPFFKKLEKDELKNKILKDLTIKKAKLSELQKDNFNQRLKLSNLKMSLNKANIHLQNATSIYEINKYEKIIIDITNKINAFDLSLKNTESLLSEISVLEKEINSNNDVYFTCSLIVYNLPSNILL